jgi:hypothetical protein
VSCEADAQAPFEPTQPEPLEGSTLSIEASVILMDIKPKVVKASPTPECETVIRCMTITSGTPQSRPSPHTISTMVVSRSKWLPEARPMDQAFLILSSLAQESNADNSPLLPAAAFACFPQVLSAPAFFTKAGLLQPLSFETVPAVFIEARTEHPSSLILSLLAQELNDHKPERASCSRKRPKEPNKALIGRPREPSLSKSIGA